MDRKKELKEQYKNTKPDMGIIIIKSDLSNKCYLEATRRIKGAINKNLFTLDFGSHINKELQKEWR
ncbi:MAG: GIY-YIG nuclease family protein, partial [Clostridia bacterium]|nr:GIY-YIG nuclease family protein [Clostridia bacterium]